MKKSRTSGQLISEGRGKAFTKQGRLDDAFQTGRP